MHIFSNHSNKLVVRVYSERFMNDFNRTALEAERDQLVDWLDKLNQWIDNRLGFYLGNCIRKEFSERVQRANLLLYGLVPLFYHRFNNHPRTYKPNKEQLFGQLESAIDQLGTVVESWQTVAFHDLPLDDVYGWRISSLPRFDFTRKSRVTYDYESYLTMHYQIAFPLNSEKFNRSEECLTAAKLPPFFRSSSERR